MNKDNSKISLTEEDLDNIVKCFEMDRERVTRELDSINADSDMYLQLLKSFREQILENQKNSREGERSKTIPFIMRG